MNPTATILIAPNDERSEYGLGRSNEIGLPHLMNPFQKVDVAPTKMCHMDVSESTPNPEWTVLMMNAWMANLMLWDTSFSNTMSDVEYISKQVYFHLNIMLN